MSVCGEGGGAVSTPAGAGHLHNNIKHAGDLSCKADS